MVVKQSFKFLEGFIVFWVLGLLRFLPLGVMSRTTRIRDRANIPCMSELTQHQLAVALLVSSAGKEAFYAGLFHDSYKVAMDWHYVGRWEWWHKAVMRYASKDDYGFVADVGKVGVDVDEVMRLCFSHHDRRIRRPEENPIKYVEMQLGEPELEKFLFNKSLDLFTVKLASFRVVNPYRAFVVSLLFERFLDRANEVYAGFFSREFGLRELHVVYRFEDYSGYEEPDVGFDDGVLSVEYRVKSPSSLRGFVVEHVYSPERGVRVNVEGKHVELYAGFSDLLVFPLPTMGGFEIRALAPIEEFDQGRLREGLVRGGEDCLVNALRRSCEDVAGLVRDSSLEQRLRGELLDALENYRRGEPECIFCGAEASYVVAGSLARFVDVDRITPFGRMACAPCKLAYIIEEANRLRIPLSIMSLPAIPRFGEVIEGFEEVVPGFSLITPGLPPIITIADEPWARLASQIFYDAVATPPDDSGLRRIRNKDELNVSLFRYFLTRRVLLYPVEFKVVPLAIISAWTKSRQKKFILNIDSASGFVVLPGIERDLTYEDLDVLEPVARLDDETIRKTYTIIKQIYGVK